MGGVPIGHPNHFLRDRSAPAVLPVSADSPIIAVSTREPVGRETIHGVHAHTGQILWSRGPEVERPIDPEEARWSCAWQAACGSAGRQEPFFVIGWVEGNHAPTALEFCKPDGSVFANDHHHGHLLLEGPADGQAFAGERWPGVPRANERAYFAIPPYDSVHAPDHSQIGCGADMRLLVSLSNLRRLEFAPAFEPSHFIMTAWSESWIRMRDEIPSLSISRS